MKRRNLFAVLLLMAAVSLWGCEVNVQAAYDTKTGGSGSASGGGDGGGSMNGTSDGGGVADGTDAAPDDADNGGGDGGNGDWRWGGPWEPYENQDWIERGDMIVNHVAGCIQCHTKLKPDGTFNKEERQLAGQEGLFDFNPMVEDLGAVHPANITPSENGIRDWDPEKVKKAITKGYYVPEDKEDTKVNRYIMHPIMPYWSFNVLRDRDLNSVVAYLRSLDAVNIDIPDRQDLGKPWANIDQRTKPIKPIDLEESMPPIQISDTTSQKYKRAVDGRYWANIALCVDCHTPTLPPIPPKDWEGDANFPYRPAKDSLLLRGGKFFPTKALLGLPVPPWPGAIFSRNLTPGKNGVGQYSPQQIVKEINTGKDAEDQAMCPPMPAGAGGYFSDMPDHIKLKAATYVTNTEARPPTPLDTTPFLQQAKKNGAESIPNCKPPAQ